MNLTIRPRVQRTVAIRARFGLPRACFHGEFDFGLLRSDQAGIYIYDGLSVPASLGLDRVTSLSYVGSDLIVGFVGIFGRVRSSPS